MPSSLVPCIREEEQQVPSADLRLDANLELTRTVDADVLLGCERPTLASSRGDLDRAQRRKRPCVCFRQIDSGEAFVLPKLDRLRGIDARGLSHASDASRSSGCPHDRAYPSLSLDSGAMGPEGAAASALVTQMSRFRDIAQAVDPVGP